ncbi:MAG: hypothetical protein K0R00_4174 [Herbinix sp.]|jgi:hypothetical protein|nr:hypothetical protein [Herbinix sp.]
MKKRWYLIVGTLFIICTLIFYLNTEKKLSIQTNIKSYSSLSSAVNGIKMNALANNLKDAEFYWTTSNGEFLKSKSKDSTGLSVTWCGPSIDTPINDAIMVNLTAKNKQGKILASSSISIARNGVEYYIIEN